MAKRERSIYAWIRRGNSLLPELDYDLRALDGIANGQRVRIEVKEFRNLDRHRAYWAMLHEAVESTECALSPERLHEVLKLETGVVDLIQLPSGYKVAIPGSIAFDKMPEAEFIRFFQSAERWLAETYGYAPESTAA